QGEFRARQRGDDKRGETCAFTLNRPSDVRQKVLHRFVRPMPAARRPTWSQFMTAEVDLLAQKIWDYHHLNHRIEKSDAILVLARLSQLGAFWDEIRCGHR